MVARISSIKTISKALNYNEQKVKAGHADLLVANGFLKDAERLSFYDKLEHFQRLQSLNERVVTNTLHVSLNFDPAERIDENKLREIAEAYMDGIGFGKQPYLVYRHEDAGHPHVHIVSTNIQTDGSRISMHNLGRNQSETTRKAIEQTFGLKRAEGNGEAQLLQPVSVSKIQYGKGALRQAVSNVLKAVLPQYNYTSIEQLNAILRGYNLIADKGKEGSRISRYHGLQYRVLNEKEETVGAPIKASSLHSRPTLSHLEKRFAENKLSRPRLVQRTKQALDWVLGKAYSSREALKTAAEKEGIQILFRQGKEGVTYGVTYVDVKSKLVINGSELGKKYSAKGLMEQLQQNSGISKAKATSPTHQPKQKGSKPESTPGINNKPNDDSIIGALMLPEEERDEVAHPLRKRKRRKKRRNL